MIIKAPGDYTFMQIKNFNVILLLIQLMYDVAFGLFRQREGCKNFDEKTLTFI